MILQFFHHGYFLNSTDLTLWNTSEIISTWSLRTSIPNTAMENNKYFYLWRANATLKNVTMFPQQMMPIFAEMEPIVQNFFLMYDSKHVRLFTSFTTLYFLDELLVFVLL